MFALSVLNGKSQINLTTELESRSYINLTISALNSFGIDVYFKDDKKEAEKLRRFRDAVNKAKANYVACLANDKLFESVYIQY